MTTMSDVAKKSGVSTATVSRVLQSPESVKDHTKYKVLQAIEALNYKPNILARNFRKTETKSLLVVIPRISNNVFSEILSGIEWVANQQGYQVILKQPNKSFSKANYDYIDYLRQQQVDGVIFLTVQPREVNFDKTSQSDAVVSVSDYLDPPPCPTVMVDNEMSGGKATQHLIQLGHDSISHISGPMDLPMSQDRLKGYVQALESHALPVKDEWIQEGDFTIDSGYQIMNQLLTLNHPPTAVFAANDEMAMGAIKAAHNRGVHIPNDLSIVGFDDIKFSSVMEPGLTTIAQPMFDMGKKAMTLLLERMNGTTIMDQKVILPTKLVVRESSGTKM
ncbi:LacI family DNA-binding transcriptional regulator [Tuberibacillus sp. Marseille-P3662]|uniref:LacI family DNA-binding transcriptional regulator n=1 Tax=Tuberibacillus sp. Marseille-P3662 TaxID=1965358 RepID=UPI000A1CCA53|nr:LacI family DNA-binding transcriptional regulator [Tuberibacillus sp. Marseille-P3662]